LTKLVKAEKKTGPTLILIQREKTQSRVASISHGKITIGMTNEKRISNTGIRG